MNLPLLLFALASLALVIVFAYLVSEAKRQGARTPDHPQEATFVDLDSGGGSDGGAAAAAAAAAEKLRAFGSIFDEPSLDISFVVPMYNEEERLPIMMEEALAYAVARREAQPAWTCEFVLVDDGSKDTTVALATEIGRRHRAAVGAAGFAACSVRVLRLAVNHGKGGAVRKGMLRARGALLLMVDADGATKFADLEQLEASLEQQPQGGGGGGGLRSQIAVGSRAHLAETSKASRSLFRTVLMHGFHLFVGLVSGVKGVEDTQCGFKLFTRRVGRRLFPSQHIERWAFDVELLFLASRCGAGPVREVAVNWSEIDGSKLDVVSDSIKMARDLLLIRFCYLTTLWALDERAAPSKSKSD